MQFKILKYFSNTCNHRNVKRKIKEKQKEKQNGGKYKWQLWKKQKFGGRIKIYLELKCMTKIIQGAEKHELKYFKVLQF